MSEFDLINQYFKSTTVQRDDVLLGIGDDCALLSPPPGKLLSVSTDTLISGVHFPENTLAEDIGYKSLAVNLSDLAAMGAEPAWVSLAISLPEANEAWIRNFMYGFNQLATAFNVALIGGDTTRGNLSITVNVTGFVDANAALKRSGAKSGDIIFVTGNIGDARLGLDCLLKRINVSNPESQDYVINALNRPVPRVAIGQLLTRFSKSAIDLSDGLLADLTHICTASSVGASIQLEKIPLSKYLLEFYSNQPDWQTVCNAGDDYELCFTCPEKLVGDMLDACKQHDIQVFPIGVINDSLKVSCHLHGTELRELAANGYNHF